MFQKARDVHQEQQALHQLEADRACVAELLQHHGNGKPPDDQKRQEVLQHYAACREERIQNFLEALKHKRDSYFNDLSSDAILAEEGSEKWILWSGDETSCVLFPKRASVEQGRASSDWEQIHFVADLFKNGGQFYPYGAVE